jgi:hypothetical protein
MLLETEGQVDAAGYASSGLGDVVFIVLLHSFAHEQKTAVRQGDVQTERPYS